MAFNEALAVWSIALAIGGRNDGERGRAPTRDAPTGEGVGGNDEGTGGDRPYGRWGKGMGPRIREDNGGGRAVREPSLRGMGSVEKERGAKGFGVRCY